jgi:hypothetical protein
MRARRFRYGTTVPWHRRPHNAGTAKIGSLEHGAPWQRGSHDAGVWGNKPFRARQANCSPLGVPVARLAVPGADPAYSGGRHTSTACTTPVTHR